VTFNSNSGSSVNPISVQQGKSISNSPATLHQWLLFDGWYSENSAKIQFPYTPSGNITLYAKWNLIPDFLYAVDISGETNWDLLLAASDGGHAFVNVNQNSELPTQIFYKSNSNGSGVNISLDNRGLPKTAVINNNVLVFGSFRGNLFNLALIRPDQSISYYFDVDSEIDWDSYLEEQATSRNEPRFAKVKFSLSLKNVVKAVGVGVKAAVCATTPWTGPIGAVGCAGLIVDFALYTPLNNYISQPLTDVLSGLESAIGCASGIWGNIISQINCIKDGASIANNAANSSNQYLGSGSIAPLVQEASGVVSGGTAAVANVSLNKTVTTINVGGTETLVATIRPANANQSVRWTSSNEAIATVSASGTVKGERAGTATITATSIGNPSLAASCTLNVATAGSSVIPETTLAAALAWLQTNAQSNNRYIFNVSSNETIAPSTLSYSGKSNIGLTLIGAGAERTIRLSSKGSVFTVESGVTLTLGNNVTLQGRDNNDSSLVTVNLGGALVMETGSRIRGNVNTDEDGGGVNVLSGTFTMNGGEISNNVADWEGGGVCVLRGAFTMNGGRISGNEVIFGGGVYVWQGTFTMNGGTISGNIADDGGGGGVLVNTGTIIMNGGTISGNEARGGGGVNILYDSTFIMNNGKISGNTASSGGGVSCDAWYDGPRGLVTFTMDGGEISGNAASSGGGVDASLTNFTMIGGLISDNTAVGRGGGVVENNSYGGSFIMNGGQISGNKVTEGYLSLEDGGGVYVGYDFTMNGGTISGNTAKNMGGGVCVGSYGATFTMNGGTISANTASSGGGVSASYEGTFRITNGTIYGSNAAVANLRNTANSGAALYVIGSSSTAQRGTFSGSTWNSLGNLSTTNNTIRVVNGVLQ
jgi:uncharacterized repeat protein (TIGR02543 family)